jgi:hypothetical protein
MAKNVIFFQGFHFQASFKGVFFYILCVYCTTKARRLYRQNETAGFRHTSTEIFFFFWATRSTPSFYAVFSKFL